MHIIEKASTGKHILNILTENEGVSKTKKPRSGSDLQTEDYKTQILHVNGLIKRLATQEWTEQFDKKGILNRNSYFT